MEARVSCGLCWCRVCVAARQTRQAAVKVGLRASPYPRHLCLSPWFLCNSSSQRRLLPIPSLRPSTAAGCAPPRCPTLSSNGGNATLYCIIPLLNSQPICVCRGEFRSA